MQHAATLLTAGQPRSTPMASLDAIRLLPPRPGQPALRGIAIGALLIAHGHHYWEVESTRTRCVLRGRSRTALPEQPDAEARWDTDRARDLVGAQKFGDPRGNWKRQPQTM